MKPIMAVPSAHWSSVAHSTTIKAIELLLRAHM